MLKAFLLLTGRGRSLGNLDGVQRASSLPLDAESSLSSTPAMPVRPGSLYPLAVFLIASLVIAGVPLVAAELQVIEGCTLVPADWADGDSFRVRLPAGEEITVRLYGADCLEQKVTDETDARRLRSQRRYFGITRVKPEAATAIAFAKDLGRQGTDETRAFLARPFTIHTSFADARGDARFKRVYAFVFDADGRDLAAHLVAKGLARAYGVSRSTVAGESADDYREMLADLELRAAAREAGIWAHQCSPAERADAAARNRRDPCQPDHRETALRPADRPARGRRHRPGDLPAAQADAPARGRGVGDGRVGEWPVVIAFWADW
jgi:competence protein ComEA